MTSKISLFLISLSSAFALNAEEIEWKWVNGKLEQVTSPKELPKSKAEDKANFEWKIVDGQLVQIVKQPESNLKAKNKQLPIDIPNSDEIGVKNIDLTRSKTRTPDIREPEFKNIETPEIDSEKLQQLSLADQKVPLPKRFTPKPKLSTSELNLWGKSLLMTKEWIEFHTERINKDKESISRGFIALYKKIYTQWKRDVASYEDALDQAVNHQGL